MKILHSDAAERNKAPIADVLQQKLPESGSILEIASGTGQHIVHFAKVLPSWNWTPTEVDREKIASIEQRCATSPCTNIEPPQLLDVCVLPWQLSATFDAVLSINMIHASNPDAAPALFKGGSEALGAGGLLVLYGPFKFHNGATAQSNLEFDAYLKTLSPGFGIWHLEDLKRLAEDSGLEYTDIVAMPANNHMVFFRRTTE